jgi:hypothetical protein
MAILEVNSRLSLYEANGDKLCLKIILNPMLFNEFGGICGRLDRDMVAI